MNYYDLLRDVCNNQPNRILLQTDEYCYSYREMLSLADYLANKAGLTEAVTGKIILILAKGPGYQAGAFLALEKMGAVPVLLHGDCKPEVMNKIVERNDIYGLWQINSQDNTLRVVNSPSNSPVANAVMGVLTSGTTGTPKILYRTYASWVDFFPTQNKVFGVDDNARMFIHGSLSFTGNLNMFLAVLWAGGTIITCDRMHGGYWHKLLYKQQVTHIYAVPTKLQLLGRGKNNTNLLVKWLISGSQLFTRENQMGLAAAFPQAKIITYYGSSELSYISFKVLEDNREINNLGVPFDNIKVSSDQGRLYVETPFHVIGIKGRYCCGDTGYVNDRGEIIYTGRQSDWINKGGYKISCIKLCQEIRQMKGIRDVAVLPVKDQLKGQEIAAFVVAEPEITSGNLRKMFFNYLDERERPKKIVFLRELPLNDRGKVDNCRLQEYL